jgi:hypothetical protein
MGNREDSGLGLVFVFLTGDFRACVDFDMFRVVSNFYMYGSTPLGEFLSKPFNLVVDTSIIIIYRFPAG